VIPYLKENKASTTKKKNKKYLKSTAPATSLLLQNYWHNM
jgi:hypothetical protein